MEEAGALDPRSADQLRWLAIAHYVFGGLLCLAGCLPIPVFLAFAAHAASSSGEESGIALMFVVVALVPLLGFWSAGITTIVAGRSMVGRRRWTFCVVVAALTTVTCMPVGTALGVLALVVLLRTRVKEEFRARAAAPSAPTGILGLV